MLNLNKIRVIAKEKNVTLKQIAKDLKMTEHAIQRMIKVNRTKKNTLERIAKYLKVPIDFFNTDYEKNVIDIGHKINGNNNRIEGDITLSECQAKLEAAQKEIQYLKKINELLEKQQASNKKK